MSASYSLGNNPPIDYPRLLVADTDVTNPIFQDEEILAAGQIESISVFAPSGFSTTVGTPSYRRIAATLLDALAANASRLAAALKVLDIDVDTKTAATDLRATARALRDTDANSGAFAIAEMVNDPHAARERTWKQLLRLYAS